MYLVQLKERTQKQYTSARILYPESGLTTEWRPDCNEADDPPAAIGSKHTSLPAARCALLFRSCKTRE